MPVPEVPPEYVRFEENRIAQAEPDGDLESLCRLQYHRVQKFLEEDIQDQGLKDVQTQTRLALEVAQEAISRYSLNHLCLSYNGGKDCLVLLIIYLAAIYAHHIGTVRVADGAISNGAPSPLPTKLRSIYILPPHQFPEVDAFVQSSAAHYQLALASSCKSMKEAFAEYLSEHPEVQAIFVGTRRTDPNGANLKHFDPTDGGWPSFMRIHPVIDWHYRQVWTIPYCSLYDKGYTSLGGTNDTAPNPRLKISDRTMNGDPNNISFLPAYELTEDDEERLGRER